MHNYPQFLVNVLSAAINIIMAYLLLIISSKVLGDRTVRSSCKKFTGWNKVVVGCLKKKKHPAIFIT